METKNGIKVLESFGHAMMNGSKEWHNLIADDVRFTGPVDKYKGKKTFIEKNEMFIPMMRGVQMHRRIEDAGVVMTEATYKVATPSGKVIELQTCEVTQVKSGKIQSIDLYYDAEEFRAEFGMK